jgi:hypothetical protein
LHNDAKTAIDRCFVKTAIDRRFCFSIEEHHFCAAFLLLHENSDQSLLLL